MTQFSCYDSPALFVFDSFLTLPLEIKHIWNRKPKAKLGSVLYILARYPALILFLGAISLGFSSVSFQVCEFYRFICNIYFHWYAYKVCFKHLIRPLGRDSCHKRTCNDLTHFFDTLDFLPLIGVQGNKLFCVQGNGIIPMGLFRPSSGKGICHL